MLSLPKFRRSEIPPARDQACSGAGPLSRSDGAFTEREDQ